MNLDRTKLERRYFTRFWGSKRLVQPKLIEATFGDGERLLWLSPLNTRPNYYWVRIDSRWTISNWGEGEEGDFFIDHLDEILEAVEAQYGCAHEDEYESGTGRPRHNGWPALSDDSGCSWGECGPSELTRFLTAEAEGVL